MCWTQIQYKFDKLVCVPNKTVKNECSRILSQDATGRSFYGVHLERALHVVQVLHVLLRDLHGVHAPVRPVGDALLLLTDHRNLGKQVVELLHFGPARLTSLDGNQDVLVLESGEGLVVECRLGRPVSHYRLPGGVFLD